MQARTADMVLRAQMRKIDLEEKKKSLVNRAKAKAHGFKIARQIRDSILNWPSKVSSRMAAELDIDQHLMHTVLEKYIREHLEELSDIKIRVD
ncbi:MAG: hypothetical protein HQL50_11790 [Magnetococcales bacterium]|nr:hypothetical protein [Magnetococcales bacterium]